MIILSKGQLLQDEKYKKKKKKRRLTKRNKYKHI